MTSARAEIGVYISKAAIRSSNMKNVTCRLFILIRISLGTLIRAISVLCALYFVLFVASDKKIETVGTDHQQTYETANDQVAKFDQFEGY